MYCQRTYAQPAVILLGSGRGLSALVTTANTRLLIIAGDDPIAFANAFAGASPATMRRIDLIVVAPGKGPARVAAKALSLVDPERIMAIESESAPTFDAVDSVRLIGAPRTIELESTILIDIDPGNGPESSVSGWSMLVSSPSGAILLTEAVPTRVDPEIGAIVIMGDHLTSTAHLSGVPIAFARDVEYERTSPIKSTSAIAAGSSQRIPFNPSGISLPAEWIAASRYEGAP